MECDIEMNKKFWIGAGVLVIAILLLAGCTETVTIGTGEVRGTLHKLDLEEPNDTYNLQKIDVILKDDKDISILTLYRYQGKDKDSFDWYEYLEDLKGEEITLSYAQASDEGAANIISVECHNCSK